MHLILLPALQEVTDRRGVFRLRGIKNVCVCDVCFWENVQMVCECDFCHVGVTKKPQFEAPVDKTMIYIFAPYLCVCVLCVCRNVCVCVKAC